MKKLKKRVEVVAQVPEVVKKERKEVVSKLPPDIYHQLLEDVYLPIDDTTKLVFQVVRGGEYGLPVVDVRVYRDTPKFTGFTKKGITLPASIFELFSDTCVKLSDDILDSKIDKEYLEN